MSAFVYMLRCGDGSLYTGYTTDVPARLAAHREGKGAKYTRGRGPLELAYTEALPDVSSALRREAALKKLPREKKLALAARAGERITPAAPEDAEAVRALYAGYVSGSAATFAYEPPPLKEYRAWLADTARRYPFLLLRAEGRLLGFACAHAFHERQAYAWNAETTIYLAPEAAGAGRGRRLYGALLALLKEQGVHNAYGVLCSPNPASEALHRSMGFAQLGAQPGCGYKLGRWWGITTWGYTLLPAEGEPRPVRAFSTLEPELVENVLRFA